MPVGDLLLLSIRAGYARGIHKGAAATLVGGADGIGACQRFLLARSVLAAWGEPARPGLPPEGETGKGEIPIPGCRRRILTRHNFTPPWLEFAPLRQLFQL